MELRQIIEIIRECLDKVYLESPSLFEIIKNKTLCERCLVFRVAFYLQNRFSEDYFVDCDYNSSIIDGRRMTGKPIENPDGTITKRLIDIIVHKRNDDIDTDFICLELKRWDNYQGRKKDKNNLKILTTKYGYKFGFHIIFGKVRDRTKINIYQNGEKIQEEIA